jgi:tRNA-dihydrouridine synthase A
MMDWTDRHCRYFHRLLAPSALLYTEMLTTGAILHGDRDRLLAFNPEEHPLALQLGGSEPAELARCAAIAAERGYDEVNLNVGCPSDRVQRGRFGACLMLEPGLVADCVAAMRAAVTIPVTVKTRLGVDDHDSYAGFSDFVGRVAGAGCAVFVVHARKAWLSGLSPKENRDVPELRYEWVYRLKRENPGLTVVLNGGVGSVEAVERHLDAVDGVMLGRAAYHDPWLLARLQARLSGDPGTQSREETVRALTHYLEGQVARGVPVKHVSRHVLGLFQGQPGARRWRRYLSQRAHLEPDSPGLLLQALERMQPSAEAVQQPFMAMN